jgi:hypothetical protein
LVHHDLGVNVVMPLRPLHGARRRELPSGTRDPSEDLLSTVHTAAQAVWDIRRVISWVRHGDPGVSIGITGISLGGYATSLVASIEDGLACAIVGVPAVDLPHLIERHPGLHRTGKHQALLTLAQELTSVVSPLALTPPVPPEGRFIFAGLANQLAQRAARSFDSGSTGAGRRSPGTPSDASGSCAPSRSGFVRQDERLVEGPDLTPAIAQRKCDRCVGRGCEL